MAPQDDLLNLLDLKKQLKIISTDARMNSLRLKDAPRHVCIHRSISLSLHSMTIPHK